MARATQSIGIQIAAPYVRLHGGEPMKYIMTPKRLEIIALLALFASGIAILVLGVYLIIWLGWHPQTLYQRIANPQRF